MAKDNIDQTATFSTRLEKHQKDLVEEAARLDDCTPAKFIRDAAIRSAVSTLNSHGEVEFRLRKLASSLVNHIEKPEAMKIENPVYAVEEWGVVSDLYSPCIQNGPDGPMFHHGRKTKVIDEIREALENCGEQFVKIILDEWNGQGKTAEAFKPKIILKDIT